jgi:hypothetical protein
MPKHDSDLIFVTDCDGAWVYSRGEWTRIGNGDWVYRNGEWIRT